MAFNERSLDDYVDVAERLGEFREKSRRDLSRVQAGRVLQALEERSRA